MKKGKYQTIYTKISLYIQSNIVQKNSKYIKQRNNLKYNHKKFKDTTIYENEEKRLYLLLLSHGSLALDPIAATAAATDVSEDVVLDEGEACPLCMFPSDISSTDVWSGDETGYNLNSLAWSG